MNSRPVVIVLAAGPGSRFTAAGHKLIQPLGSSNVLGTTLSHAIASHLPVVVVTTEALAPAAQRYVASRDLVLVPSMGMRSSQALGMGYSIAAGVAARSEATGWIVLPADMPMVQPTTLVAVAAALGQHPVAYAQYRGRRGHPVGFSTGLYTELFTLSGDEGARRVVARYPAHPVDVDDAGVLVDIDTLADLEQVREQHVERMPAAVPRHAASAAAGIRS